MVSFEFVSCLGVVGVYLVELFFDVRCFLASIRLRFGFCFLVFLRIYIWLDFVVFVVLLEFCFVLSLCIWCDCGSVFCLI